MGSRLLAWAAIWLACTALGVFFGTTLWLNYIALGREASFGASLTVSLAEWWIWALLAPVPIWLAGRFSLARPQAARDVVVHVACGVVTAVIKALLERATRAWLFGAAPYLLPGTVALHFLIYWAIVGLTIATVYYRRSRLRELHAAQLEARLSETSLDLLRRQLQPHFLFNSMNAITELIHENPERADRMLTGLSDLLRSSLRGGGRQQVSLRDEIALTRKYLDIHSERLGDRLRISINVPSHCLDLLVPHFILQPLVENAIVHGIAPAESGGDVRVSASRDAGALELVIENAGEGLGAADLSEGVGLSNTRARLSGLHGSRASLVVSPRPGGGAVATIRLPIEIAR